MGKITTSRRIHSEILIEYTLRLIYYTYKFGTGIATGYGLDGRGIEARVPVKTRFFVVQTGSGVHPASYPMGNGGSFSGSKEARSSS
jgi:hypothetical protein